MKIDESCIDHNTVKLIKELTECIYDMIGDEGTLGFALMTLGNIRGVIEMADAMKEVLKA